MEGKKRKYYFYIVMLTLFLIFCILISESVGSASIGILDSFKLLISKLPGMNSFIDTEGIKESYKIIIWKVRLPRILLSSLVGGALAVVGCTFQTVFRNSLADPHILGISSGAALGATLSILYGVSLNFFGLGITSISAFIGALLTVMLVYRIGTLGSKFSVGNLLLTGTAISTMSSSMISFLMIYNRDAIEKVYLWTLGSFSGANWGKVSFLALISVICVTVLFLFAKDLNVLLIGDDSAQSLGIDVSKLKSILIFISSIFIATSVSVSGTIGFVGLIVPHCMRFIVGSDHRYLIPFSYLGGSAFLVICDTISRTIAEPTEVPVGVITSIFGAPYFIFLLYRNSKKGQV